MERKKLIWIGMSLGSIVGGYIPALWGAGFLSMSSFLFSAVGAFAGIWLGFKTGN